MAARILRHRSALLVLRDELCATFNEIKAHPLTQDHIPTYAALLTQWETVFGQELALRDGIASATIRMYWIDLALNSLATRVSNALLALTGDTRSHPLYIAYFGKKTLCQFRRPQLGSKLDTMRLWIPQLQGSDVPALVALGAEVEAAVAEARNTVAAHASLQQSHKYFREAGGRKEFFDHVNAVRKVTYGALSKLPFMHPELPSNFADLFFLHESDKDEKETIESVQAKIAATTEQLASEKARLQELLDEAELEAKKAAELEAKKAAAAALEKEVAEIEALAKAKRAAIAALNL